MSKLKNLNLAINTEPALYIYIHGVKLYNIKFKDTIAFKYTNITEFTIAFRYFVLYKFLLYASMF
jgi:hypothetical protein